jgi:hypothetical protein
VARRWGDQEGAAVSDALSLLAKFDGEFANGSQTYAGSGTLRYTW